MDSLLRNKAISSVPGERYEEVQEVSRPRPFLGRRSQEGTVLVLQGDLGDEIRRTPK